MNGHTPVFEEKLNTTLKHIRHISSGHNANTYHLTDENGAEYVAKTSNDPVLDIEAKMLRYLEENTTLAAPRVLYSNQHVLIMNFIPDDNTRSASVEKDAAQQLASLHKHSAPQYGFDYDTVIGSLNQPNPHSDNWIDFYRQHRLLHFGRQAYEVHSISSKIMDKLEKFCGKTLEDVLDAPSAPSLIHGDVWGGNVRTWQGKISGFIDPGLYFANPEIELAFTTMFHTFGHIFFDHYHQLNTIQPGFWEERKDVYLLYPLLVHCILYGSSYAGSVERILSRFQ